MTSLPSPSPWVLSSLPIYFLHRDSTPFPVEEGLSEFMNGSLDPKHQDRLQTRQAPPKEANRRRGTVGRKDELFRPRMPGKPHRDGDRLIGLTFHYPIPRFTCGVPQASCHAVGRD